jgi:hypothetical protein
MNPRELVDHIRSGPNELVLAEPLRFRRRTRSNPCDFKEFLQVLQSSETIRDVRCASQQTLCITEDEWVLLVKSLGRIRNIKNLSFWCQAGSRHFRPFQAVADAVNAAALLCRLRIRLDGRNFPRDSSGLTALADTLREHTTLQDFRWFDFGTRMEAGSQELSPDCVFRALMDCRHLGMVTITTTSASADAMKTLVQLPKNTYLILIVNTEHWSAVADGIREGQCNIKNLYLYSLLRSSSSEDTEAVKALASAIRLDCNLKRLKLDVKNFLTDEAAVALAEALTVNKTLRKITLSVANASGGQVIDADVLSALAYDAFSTMLQVNTSLVLELPQFRDRAGNKKLVISHNRMLIEQRLNKVGRGRLLASSQTPREAWVDALNELNSSDESPEFKVSCLYSLLRLHPDVCMLELNYTANHDST